MNNQTNFASKATDRTSDVWLTPRHILNPLGPFDLDPCAAPDPAIWPTAKTHFTIHDEEALGDGLARDWFGRVWCNPPYSNATEWLAKLARHGNGIALIFARTETNGFFSTVWDKADAVLFIKGRLSFHHYDGTKGGTAGCGSMLVAYGKDNAAILESVAGHPIHGKFINLKPNSHD